MFNKIVVGTDFSEASKAALLASINLSVRCLGHIDAVHVIPPLEHVYHLSRVPMEEEAWDKTAERQMENFFPKSLHPNSSRTIVSEQSIPGTILKHAREKKADLIVVGSHGRNALGRFFLGSVTQEVARKSEIPVMVVRSYKQVDRPYQSYNRILVPIDFSDVSIRALEFGVKLANFLSADLHLIHVVEMPDPMNYGDYPMTSAGIPVTCELNTNATLQQMVFSRKFRGHCVVKSFFGDPVQQILDYAETNPISFIVMGSHGRKGLERLLLGSVTASVLSYARIPVFTIADPQNNNYLLMGQQ
jgi:nucleotide-binding universal stress UspA family protein